tara:strand:- start:1997 stop:2647 length:651 start_codon:yes stop_codon:yes gene_type:complete
MHTTAHKEILATKLILTITGISVGYAVLRYNIAGEVRWKDLPVFVMNKGISLGSLVLLTLCFTLARLKKLGLPVSDGLLETRKTLGIVGLMYAFAHFILSSAILNASYFDLFYESNGTFTLRGGLCILGGVFALVLLWIYYYSFKEHLKQNYRLIANLTSNKIKLLVFFFTSCHLFFLGFSRWTDFDLWQAGLPPISLISFIIVFLGFVTHLIGRR